MRRNKGLDLSAVWFLIIANLIVFIATYISNDVYNDFVRIFGLNTSSFSERPWTIVTSLFIHAGLFHIFGNMITLYFFGTYVSRLIGENKFLIIYTLGGIVGNAFYMLLGDPDSTVIGASGAVFAVGGALTILRPKLKVIIFPVPVPLPLWIAVIGIFLIISIFPNVAWQAHLGGLLLGLIAGFIFRKKQRFYF